MVTALFYTIPAHFETPKPWNRPKTAKPPGEFRTLLGVELVFRPLFATLFRGLTPKSQKMTTSLVSFVGALFSRPTGGERRERCRWQIKRPERVAAVDKIEDKRKPEDFIGHRNRKTGRRGDACTGERSNNRLRHLH